MIKRLTDAFPIWVLMGALLALFHPPLFTWFGGQLIPVGLGIIMLGMGLTLSWEDFSEVFRKPHLVFLGVLLQYTVMPFLGWSIANLFGLPAPLAVGLMLVANCPGGTASNVVTYLAKGDVPLSVTMTSVSTLLAVIVTPVLTTILAGSRIDVNGWGLFWSTVQVVIFPIAAGVFMNRFMPKLTKKLVAFSPLVAVIFITLIVASIVGGSRDHILKSGFSLILAVFSLHACGFLFGFILSRFAGAGIIAARTISIEVGMQNSGLGVVLARQNFTDPLVAIPSAISSVFHSVIASSLAAVWRRDADKLEVIGSEGNIFSFTVETIDGQKKNLSEYAGKVLMIVNTASRCGFTPQYKAMEELYQKYKNRDFEILAFPANNFMGQEPGNNQEIKQFCDLNYRITFPLFSKISVKGKDIHPLYQFLTEKSGHNGPIGWNFNKFLVDRDGKVVARYGSREDPLSSKITSELEKILSNRV